MALAAVKWAISSRTVLKHLFPIQNGALYCVFHKSTYSSLPDDYNCKVELALTSDGRTIVCYHPSVDIPYEHTKPIPRPDPVHNHEETHDQVLKTRLEEKSEHLEQGPMIEQLSKMFFTTKHRWYPRGHPPVHSCVFLVVGPSTCGMWDATSAWPDEWCHVHTQDPNR
uniref:Large ribosomal subunit protein mL42 n=1 Tax=Equus caballus TaxID=9796 RepID=A0A3Q2LMG2_HORSE